MTEPSVLDFVRSWLDPRIKNKLRIPSPGAEFLPGQVEEFIKPPERDISVEIKKKTFPVLTLAGLFLFILGQGSIEQTGNLDGVAIVLFLAATISLGIAWRKHEWDWDNGLADQETPFPNRLRLDANFVASLTLALLAFIAFGSLKFNFVNSILWFGSVFFLTRGLIVFKKGSTKRTFATIVQSVRLPWNFKITSETLLSILLITTILFFRISDLNGIPGEPFSDHAEKLLDVKDVLDGEYRVFFPRNTGRESLQFFITAAIASWTDLGLSFMSLKVGTALIGLFGLPFIYLLGREIGTKRLGFFAVFLAGISYWLNVTSRIGLRFPLYPSLAAPAIYFFIRGMRRGDRNSLLLSGIFLGLGLHGYSPFRIVPFAISLGCLLYFLQMPSKARLLSSLEALFVIGLTSFLVFLPLARYVASDPMMFSYRALTRMTGLETLIPDSAIWIFLKNNLDALLMFNVDNGGIWVHSIPGRPALDTISGGLFLFGLIVLALKIFIQRNWIDLYLLLLIPVFLLPSTLSIAFPSENPSLNRTGAAAISVFLIAAMALDRISVAILRHSRKLAFVFISMVLAFTGMLNYDLVFNQFKEQFLANAWNTSEIGADIRYFSDLGNDVSNAYVIPYPYWVDTRLVGIQAGFPEKDFALTLDHIDVVVPMLGEKLFIFKENDLATLEKLQKLFPTSYMELRESSIPNKNYWIMRTQ